MIASSAKKMFQCRATISYMSEEARDLLMQDPQGKVWDHVAACDCSALRGMNISGNSIALTPVTKPVAVRQMNPYTELSHNLVSNMA